MRRENTLCVAVFLTLLWLNITPLIIKGCQALETQDVEFEVIDYGDTSGYYEETYAVVKSETEWAKVWTKHTILYLSPTAYPKINFSKNMVVCAFMGKRPTTGYSLSVERIWAEEERIHVKIVKRSPPKDLLVSPAITYPYVFVSVEMTDLEIVFDITEENGTIVEHILPEFPIVGLVLVAFVVISTAMVVLIRKTRRTNHAPEYTRH